MCVGNESSSNVYEAEAEEKLSIQHNDNGNYEGFIQISFYWIAENKNNEVFR